MVQLQQECSDFKDIYLSERQLPNDVKLANQIMWKTNNQYVFLDNVLYLLYQPRTKGVPHLDRLIKQVALPKVLRSDVLKSYHDSIAGGGHLGTEKTFESIRQKFY